MLTKIPRCPHCHKLVIFYPEDGGVIFVCPENAAKVEPEWVAVKTIESIADIF